MQALKERKGDAAKGERVFVIQEQNSTSVLKLKSTSQPSLGGDKVVSTPLQSTECKTAVSKDTLEYSQPVIAKYESIDHNGRIWGAPSAFGRGQCLNCPHKAAPPSMRCKNCQLVMAQSEPMLAGDLHKIRDSLNGLLRKTSGRRCDDIAQRLDQLYSKLETGSIPQSIQSALLMIVESLSKNNGVAQARETEAATLVAALTAEHWEQHKAWLVGLKRLLSVHEAHCKPMNR